MSRPRHVINVRIDKPFALSLSRPWLRRLARHVLKAEGVAAAEVGILLTDDAAIQALNRRYTGEDAPTDVLSFSLLEGEPFASPDGILRLGEVVISYPTAARQAEEQGHSPQREVAHLLIHGLLHLLGYDHVQPEEERRMREREEPLLKLTIVEEISR